MKHDLVSQNQSNLVRNLSAFAAMALLVLFFQFSLAADIKANCTHDATTFRCVKFLKNYDADTITVNIPNVHPLIGEKVSVRVLGIDAPEIKGKQKCEKDKARTAQRLAENLLSRGKDIELRNVQRDKYFRILADVFVDGQSIKDLMIKNNLAYAYDGGTKHAVDWCKERIPASK